MKLKATIGLGLETEELSALERLRYRYRQAEPSSTVTRTGFARVLLRAMMQACATATPSELVELLAASEAQLPRVLTEKYDPEDGRTADGTFKRRDRVE